MEAHPKGALRAAEHLRPFAHVEPVPGDQPQHLTLALLELHEGGRERLAEGQRLGRIAAGRVGARLVGEAQAEVAAPAGRAVLVGEHVVGDRVEPRQRAVGNEVAPAPGHRERVGHHFLGRLPP